VLLYLTHIRIHIHILLYITIIIYYILYIHTYTYIYILYYKLYTILFSSLPLYLSFPILRSSSIKGFLLRIYLPFIPFPILQVSQSIFQSSSSSFILHPIPYSNPFHLSLNSQSFCSSSLTPNLSLVLFSFIP
jgi:hypothetical protein